jgi:hypothetical protein
MLPEPSRRCTYRKRFSRVKNVPKGVPHEFASVAFAASREPFKLINFTVSIDISNDIDRALAIVLDVLASEKRVLKTPPPTTSVAALRRWHPSPRGPPGGHHSG